MSKKLSKFFIVGIFISIIMILKSTMVQALTFAEIDSAAMNKDTFEITSADMANRKGDGYIYCVNHATKEHAMTGTYLKGATVEIVGNTATANGNSVTNELNGILAYVLQAENYGTGYQKPSWNMRQLAVWSIMSTGTVDAYNGDVTYIYPNGDVYATPRYKLWHWFSAVGNQLYPNTFTWTSKRQTNSYYSNGSNAQTFLNNAYDYALNVGTSGAGEIKVEKGNGISTNNSMAGPFQVSYSGNISGYTVYDTSNAAVTAGIQITDANGNVFSTIPSNQDFYIKNTSGKTIKSIKIDVGSSQSVYTAKLHFLVPQVLDAGGGATRQYMMAVETGTTTGSDSVTINFTTQVRLTVNKVDAVSNGTKLEGAQFVLVHASKYAQATLNNGIYTVTGWVSDKANATTMVTNSNGQIIIDLYEDTNRLYALQEVKARTGYQRKLGFLTNKFSSNISKNSTYPYDYGDDYTIYFDLNSVNYSSTAQIWLTNSKGKLTIYKYPTDTSGRLAGAKFKLYCEDISKWLKVTGSAGSYAYADWVTDEASATEMVTDSNGKIVINNLRLAKYQIKETSAANGYSVQISSAKTTTTSSIDGVSVSSSIVKFNFKDTNGSLNIYDKPNKLVITKKDGDTGAALTGAVVSFILYNANTKQYVLAEQTSTGIYNVTGWTSSLNSASVISTSSDTGTLEVNRLPTGTYWVYEQSNTDSSYDIYIGEGNNGISFTVNDGNTSVSISNKKKVSVSGYVWVDEPQGKENDTNGLYDESAEAKLAGITVRMRKKSDNTIIAETTTDASGNYVFSNVVPKSKLNEYYVEFDYSTAENAKYKSYIPVKFNATTSEEVQANVSRALADEIPMEDAKLAGIASTYKGTNKTDEGLYGLSGISSDLYNEKNNTIENINLGLKNWQTSYRVEQDIAYVKIKYNNYEYKYIYGGTQDNTYRDTDVPVVKWEGYGGAYTRDIYPSDVSQIKDNSHLLKVYIVYKISVQNTTTTDREELYKEKELMLNSVVEQFDSTRYILDTTNDVTEESIEEKVRIDIGSWEVTEDEGGIAKAKYNSNKLDRGITPNSEGRSESIYVQFRLTEDAMKTILENGQLEEKENGRTIASVDAYHNYQRYDYGWNYLENTNIGDIKTKELQDHKTVNETRTATARQITFRLGNDRTVSGIVFEDKVVSTNGEKLGNGRYDDGEGTIDNVTVELLNTSGNTAKVYPKGDGTGVVESEAKVQVATGNSYSFKGVLPGEYYVRFTYGDGTQKIEKYKSTIVTSDVAKSAIQDDLKGNSYSTEWYKNLEGTNYSVAVDNLNTRTAYNDGNEITTMDARTPKASITIENDSNTTDGDELGAKAIFEGFNFGIIVQPKLTATTEKVITNVKLTNAQNNVLFSGNPKNGGMAGVTDLDGTSSNGSTYVRMELQNEMVYGSTLEITYGVKVINTSDINYYEKDVNYKGWYYLFGLHDDSYSGMVQLSVDKVVDYLDPALTYVATGSDTRIISLSKNSANKWVDSENNVKDIGSSTIDASDYKKLLLLEDFGILARGNEINFIANAEKVLSTEDDDMEFINKVAVVKLNKSLSEDDKGNSEAEESLKLVRAPELPEPAEAKATITPPTGEDKQIVTIYAIAGIVSLIVLLSGIVIIKKKVL